MGWSIKSWIPVGRWTQNLNMLDKSKKILVYCRSGSHLVHTTSVVVANGFSPINMRAGINSGKAEKLPLQ